MNNLITRTVRWCCFWNQHNRLYFFMLECYREAGLVANYLAVGAWVLVALLLGANITLRIGTLAFTGDRHELSERQLPSPTQTIVTAPALDMPSEVGLPTQPTTQSAPEVLGTVGSAHAARTEAQSLDAVFPAQPTTQSAPAVLGTMEPAPQAPRAEAQLTKKRVTRKQPSIKQRQLYGNSFSNNDH
jgi:hypothetical protein